MTRIAAFFISLLILLIWWGLSTIYPPFILPSPPVVLARAADVLHSGLLIRHFLVTAGEALSGFFIGVLAALPLGYLMAKKPWLEKASAPFISASQAIPIMALAPLLIIWFGFGPASKVLVAALVTFFPVLTNIIVGLHSSEPRAYELMAVLGASKWQIFKKLEVPAALPVVFAGLRVGLALSVTGAIVGEFTSSDRGLGYLVNMAAGMMDTPLMFVALFSLAILGLLFYAALDLVRRILLPWSIRKS